MYFLLGSPSVLRFRNRRDEIAFVDDRQPSAVEPLAEPGDAKRRRSHVDAAAAAAEVERTRR